MGEVRVGWQCTEARLSVTHESPMSRDPTDESCESDLSKHARLHPHHVGHQSQAALPSSNVASADSSDSAANQNDALVRQDADPIISSATG